MRICIDLDGVICNLKEEGQKYEDLLPVTGAVESLQEFKANGHYIIINTARHMKTCQGNLGAVGARISLITLNWLEKYQIPYDEIYFGKPHADIYIDDNAYRFNSWDVIDSDGSNLPISKEKTKATFGKMNFIIPMAGYGARFIQSGYQLPKMLLEAHGKTLLEWSLNSLPLHLASTVIFVGLKEHENKFSLQKIIEKLYPAINSKFIFLEKVTRGQAETTYLALKLCNADEPIVIFNIDTFFSSSTLESNLLNLSVDGVLGTFMSTENRFSFAALDDANQYVTEVQEKEVISSNALTGLYTFKNLDDFAETYEHHLTNNLTTKGEYYIAPMYNYLIAKGKKYILDYVDKHYILGTPSEYTHFLNLQNF